MKGLKLSHSNIAVNDQKESLINGLIPYFCGGYGIDLSEEFTAISIQSYN